MVTVLVSGSLLSYFVSNYLYREQRERLIVQAQEISFLVGAALALPGSPAAMLRLADTFERLLGAAVWITDASGEVVITSPRFRQDRGRRLPAAEIERVLAGKTVVHLQYDPQVRENVLSVAIPIWVNGRPAGAVVVRSPLTGMAATWQGIRRELGRAALLAVVFAALVGLTLSRRISGPVREMTAATRKLAAGQYRVNVPVRGDDELAELAGAINELSERLDNTIAALNREKSQTQAILTSIAEGVIAAGARGEVLFANGPARRLLGCDDAPDQDGGARLAELTGTPVREAAREALMRALTQNQAVQIQVEGLGGRQLAIVASPVRGSAGESQGAVALLRDISEEIRQERNRREFLASVSHELKTPLTSIRGFLQALVDKVAGDEKEVQRYHRLMLQETIRLTRLVNSLLDLSRIESGVLQLHLQPVDLGELADEAVNQMLPESDDKGVSLENKVGVEEELPLVWADRDRVKQILINLLDNAVRHTPAGGQVEVSAHLVSSRGAGPGAGADTEVEVHVRDTGVGIPAEELPNIWERFYKVDKSRRRYVEGDAGGMSDRSGREAAGEGSGTGLGLAIVKELVLLHGGRLGVDSEPGRGSDFWFTLPVQGPRRPPE
ncbi:MAG TPA: cell wall metabolism sensor histidine kinase WalK [Firmicutes bacterium]|nr:cell wall metabolism sensor histidine kinase WalK [Bacillota bacterium]